MAKINIKFTKIDFFIYRLLLLKLNQYIDFFNTLHLHYFFFSNMGACESSSAQQVSKFADILPQHKINSIARKITASLRKRITKDNRSHFIHFLREFELNEMFVQNSKNVEMILAEVVTQFRNNNMRIVTWRDTGYPDDMPANVTIAMFEILIYKRDLSISRL